MSKNIKLNSIFQNSECPSDETLMLYFEKKLTPESNRLVELHLVDCEICNDILAGFETAGNIDSFKKEVLKINVAKNKKIAPDIVPIYTLINVKKFAIAASILIILGSSYLFYYLIDKTKKDSLADKTESYKSNNLIVPEIIEKNNKIEEIVPVQKEEQSEMQTNREEKYINKEASLNSYHKKTVTENTNEKSKSIDANLSSGKPSFESPIVQSEDLTAESDFIGNQAVSADENTVMKSIPIAENTISGTSLPASKPMGESARTVKSTQKSEKAEYANEPLLNLAKADFENSNYLDSKEKLTHIVANDPKNQEALFYLAKSERMLKNYGASNLYLDKIISLKKSAFLIESEWLKAQNLIDGKNKNDAIKLLKKIASESGKYANTAAEKLKELEN
jgi:hypothetical protein